MPYTCKRFGCECQYAKAFGGCSIGLCYRETKEKGESDGSSDE